MVAEQSIQVAWTYSGRQLHSLEIPSASAEIMPGVVWGCATELFTPAFWKYQSAGFQRRVDRNSFRLGNTITEELAVCLLGGFGMPAELGLAAFHRLRDRSLLAAEVRQEEIERALSEPFHIGNRQRRYRFPKQKARYLWHALQMTGALPEAPRQLRDFLVRLPGIGPKTASWVVRNHYACDEVAILDVHILRAGVAMGLFLPGADPARDYFKLEARFLQFCGAIGEPASLVDSLMWDYMRRIGPTAINRTHVQRETVCVQ